MAEIVLINPRFELSFWGLEHALPFMGKRAALPVAALPWLAALTPEKHRITIIDENVEAIDFERCAKADIVGVTGMVVQRVRMREILAELKRRGTFTVVGGPWVSVSEGYFGDLAEVTFVGEAEESWPCFLADWEAGRAAARYEQAEKTDMTRVPAPRIDLLRMRHYAFGSVQFSRGCPFQCEFCDIIVVFGRWPRLKTSAQIIAELEALRVHHLSIVFIADDNLIGNKRAIKAVLRDVIDWQRANGFPLTDLRHRGLDGPGRRRRAHAVDDRGQHRGGLRGGREPERAVPARDEEAAEPAARRQHGREGPPHPGLGPGGVGRHDPGLRQRRRAGFRRPAPLPDGGSTSPLPISTGSAIPISPARSRPSGDGGATPSATPGAGSRAKAASF